VIFVSRTDRRHDAERTPHARERDFAIAVGFRRVDEDPRPISEIPDEELLKSVAPCLRCYTEDMPTVRPRHMLTETDEVAEALRVAAQRWPDDRERPAKLLLDLVREGHRAIADDANRAGVDRRAAIERTRGALTGAYPAGYLDQLRGDWPE
jgi:hypothetical protein